jgi:hypothetical protein
MIGKLLLILLMQPLPLPEIPMIGQPEEGFYGAIGNQIRVRYEIDRTEVEVGEVIALNLVIEGVQNPEQIRTPKLGQIEDFSKNFQVEFSGQHFTSMSNGFQYKLRPRNELVKEIPALEYRYFNPSAPRENVQLVFPTTYAEPISIRVKPMKKGGEKPPPCPALIEDRFHALLEMTQSDDLEIAWQSFYSGELEGQSHFARELKGFHLANKDWLPKQLQHLVLAIGEYLLGHQGPAILHIKQAELADPTSFDSRVTIPELLKLIPEHQYDRSWRSRFGWNEHQGIVSILFFGVSATIFGRIRLRSPVTGLLFLILLFSITFEIALRYDRTRKLHEQLIVEPGHLLRSGNGELYTVLENKPLGMGASIVPLGEREDWIQVKMNSGKIGWLPKKAVGTTQQKTP